MPGRFEGMSDAEWELVEDIFPFGKGGGTGVAHGYKGKGVLIQQVA